MTRIRVCHICNIGYTNSSVPAYISGKIEASFISPYCQYIEAFIIIHYNGKQAFIDALILIQ